MQARNHTYSINLSANDRLAFWKAKTCIHKYFEDHSHRARSLPCENGKVASDPGVSVSILLNFVRKSLILYTYK